MADPEGMFCVAFDDATMEGDPTWTRLDVTYNVTSISWDRGRMYEFDETTTGTATVKLVDTTGDLDPTNVGSAYYGKLVPLKQASIGLENPDTSEWSELFRGFISSWEVEPHPSGTMLMITVELVDGLELLAAAEMHLDGANTFGTETSGNLVYAEDTALDAVQTRIGDILTNVGWPLAKRVLFTGNVSLQEVTYPPRMSALAAIKDCADAEFPGTSNFFISKTGDAVFHGRYARFDWDNEQYAINEWSVGDLAAADASPSTVVPVSPPLRFYLDKETIYTAAVATPQDIADADIDGQYTSDSTAIGKYGIRTWSAENLLTLGGDDSTTAAQETLLMADYVKDNYAEPLLRVGQLTIRPQDPNGTYGAATWALICDVEISDLVNVTTTHVGGGGINDAFFVEGIHGQMLPMNATHPEVTLTLDVSPQGFYDNDPRV